MTAVRQKDRLPGADRVHQMESFDMLGFERVESMSTTDCSKALNFRNVLLDCQHQKPSLHSAQAKSQSTALVLDRTTSRNVESRAEKATDDNRQAHTTRAKYAQHSNVGTKTNDLPCTLETMQRSEPVHSGGRAQQGKNNRVTSDQESSFALTSGSNAPPDAVRMPRGTGQIYHKSSPYHRRRHADAIKKAAVHLSTHAFTVDELEQTRKSDVATLKDRDFASVASAEASDATATQVASVQPRGSGLIRRVPSSGERMRVAREAASKPARFHERVTAKVGRYLGVPK